MVKYPSHAFRTRLIALVSGLLVVVVLCIVVAVTVNRDASGKLQQLVHVETKAASLARQFRGAVDDLHGALLRVGIDSAEESGRIIQERRQSLSAWLDERRAGNTSEAERKIVERIAAETRSYFIKLDTLPERTNGLSQALDRNSIVMFDDTANRLQSIADEFAAAHDEELRDLLDSSLDSLLRMRNLVFVCLAFLLIATLLSVALLYRDVVRPLRMQLVHSAALLAKREKLAALGTLAAGVAHEIRNPLTAIKANLYTLRRGLTSVEARKDMQLITNDVDRLERIVRDVLGYARPADAMLAPVELKAWLGEFAAYIAPTMAAAGIELKVSATVIADVLVDTNQLRQIVLNLVRNAQEAFENRQGIIELALHRDRASLRGVASDVAVIVVSDNGPGIPQKIQARLFDPFFTTKASGTGLGLSIVARLVENQGGEIQFQSAPGAGTRFAVSLPLRPVPVQTALT